MNDFKVTTIDLIRHGEPVGGNKYRGHLDDPLSEKGWKQMRDAVADHCPWELIVSSSLKRCADFAEELAMRHNLPIEIDPRLMEIGFGDWEGMTAAELQARDPNALHRFWSDPTNNTPPGAETLTEFRERVMAGWRDTVQRHQGKHLLMVGHAGMMRMIIREILDMPLDRMFRIQVPNAGITRITIDHFDNGELPRLHFHAGTLI
jgi:alpha-ribazole phosphatase/probable phosphoglycerate mutase